VSRATIMHLRLHRWGYTPQVHTDLRIKLNMIQGRKRCRYCFHQRLQTWNMSCANQILSADANYDYAKYRVH